MKAEMPELLRLTAPVNPFIRKCACWLCLWLLCIVSFMAGVAFLLDVVFGGRSLPNGYTLVTTNPSTTAIFAPLPMVDPLQSQQDDEYRHDPFGHYFAGLNLPQPPRPRDSYPSASLAVAAQVRLIGVDRDLVFGFVEPSPRSELQDLECPGWFILDTKAEWVECGLEEAAWNARLNELGVQRRRLRRP